MTLRTALPLAIVLPVTLAPALAWGAPPASVTARLEYQRGPGAEACAGEAGLRLEHQGAQLVEPAQLGQLVEHQGAQLVEPAQLGQLVEY